jgi:hypothetical protein
VHNLINYDDIKQVIEEYQCDPSVDLDNCDKDFNISFQLLWEMVKMKIRGSAISFSLSRFLVPSLFFPYLYLRSQKDLKYTVYLN